MHRAEVPWSEAHPKHYRNIICHYISSIPFLSADDYIYNSRNQASVMHRLPRFQITDDLHISVGGSMVQITPSHGLRIAETLARKSFRRVLAEEAETVAPKPATKRRMA